MKKDAQHKSTTKEKPEQPGRVKLPKANKTVTVRGSFSLKNLFKFK